MAINNLSFLGNYNFDNTALNVAINGGVAYVAAGDNGLLLLNVSNPSKPTLLGHLKMQIRLVMFQMSP